jgi:ABC-type phosphate transport system substrate-binding protein
MRTLLALIVASTAVLGCGKKPDVIVAYGRENSSGTYMYFKEHVLKNADFAPNVLSMPGTAAVINAVSKDTNAIGYGGIGYVKGVRSVPVKKDAASPAVDPTLENVVDGSYPISRYLYFYTAGEPQGATKHFIDWVRGPEGQKVCAAVGYYPLPEKDRGAEPGPAPAGNAKLSMKGSDTMVILGNGWSEAYTQKQPHIKLELVGGGSGTGIKALKDGETQVCQSSRPMNAKEREEVKAKQGKDVVEFKVALDGLAVFVHEHNPLKDITLDQLKAVYTAKTSKWSELGVTLR